MGHRAAADRRRSDREPRAAFSPALLRTLALTAAVACGALGPGPVRAQTVTVGAGVATSGALARLQVQDVRTEGGTVAAGLVLSPAPGLDLTVRDARALGALGTLTFEVDAAARVTSDGLRARGRVVGRGGIGPVAGRLEARAWSAPPETFDPLSDPGPERAHAGASLLLTADGRVDRTWVLGGRARLERGADGASTVDLRAELRGRRLLAREWDGRVMAGARVAGSGDGRLALGVGFVHTPRRAPEITALVHLDAAPAAGGGIVLRPGLEASGGTSLAGGRLDVRLRLRPAAAERAPLFASVGWRIPSGDATWRLAAAAMHGPGVGAGAALQVAYERPLSLP